MHSIVAQSFLAYSLFQVNAQSPSDFLSASTKMADGCMYECGLALQNFTVVREGLSDKYTSCVIPWDSGLQDKVPCRPGPQNTGLILPLDPRETVDSGMCFWLIARVSGLVVWLLLSFNW